MHLFPVALYSKIECFAFNKKHYIFRTFSKKHKEDRENAPALTQPATKKKKKKGTFYS